MRIRQIDTEEPQDVREFMQVPFELYRACEQWVPPIVSSIKLVLDRNRHPFYKHSDAGFFVAEQDGAAGGRGALGRIAVLENRHYNDYRKAKVAFFYYFDTVNDVEVARGLIEAARTWAAARGLTLLMGPKGMLRSDPYGVLIEGYEYFAGMTMPYNYPYYASLLESIGMEKEVDYVSGYMKAEDEFPDRLFRLVERIKKRSGFWVKSFKSKRELRGWIPAIQRVNNEAFTQVWGYYPIDEAEVQMIGDQLLMVSDPDLMKVVMKGDAIAGFAFIFPDVGEALKATGGRLWPFGWARLLVALRRSKRLLANGVGLLPEYQGLGASAMLYAELNNTVRERRAEYCEFVQVMETNINSLGDMNMLGVQWHKRHRVYRLDI